MATWPKSYGDREDAGELERRRYAVENAIGTLRIEGMEMPTDELDIMERYASGEIGLEQVREQLAALPLKSR